jgi:hypothetical protein
LAKRPLQQRQRQPVAKGLRAPRERVEAKWSSFSSRCGWWHDKAYSDKRGNSAKDGFADRLFAKIVQMLAVDAPEPASIGQRLREQIDPHFLGRPFVPPTGRPDSQNKLAGPQEGERRDALTYLNEWALDAAAPAYCALLGEYGMGKTTTSVAFARDLLVVRDNTPSLPLPIYLDLHHLGDQAKPEPVLDAIIDTVLQRGWQSGRTDTRLSAAEVIRLVQQDGAVAIFDGLDEVLVHLSPAAG